MSKEDLDELAKLPGKIQELSASDPAKLTVQARSRASQLATLSRNLEVMSTALRADQLALVTAARARITKADAAVTAASTLLDGDNVMEGVGTERWRDLWLAAEAFVHTEEDHEYHDLSEEAVCVLCQQPLADDAKLRFRRFEDFMKGEARTELTRAQDALNSLLEGLRGLPFGTLVSQDLVDLVGAYDDAAAKLLLPTCAEALALRDSVLANEPAPKSDADSSLTDRFAQLRTAIHKASAEETAIADKTADVDSNALAANKLKLRLDELELRKKLTARRVEVSRDHDRRIRIERLAKASKKCDTTAASRQSTSLAKEYVDKVCAAFTVEAKGLGLDRVPVELVFDRTTLGASFIKVALVDAPNVSVATVLSEGEQRVTAVAGFFADLTESGDESTLVFDDPVSSLDQDFREQVAKRLLLEAGKRQVLVFSHDFTFVQYLYEQKRYLDDELAAGSRTEPVASVEYVHITRTSSGTGVPTTAEQWRTVPIAERIKRLNERIQNAGVLYKSKDDVAYAKEAKDIVSSIRETWEYFVEQVLLEGVVRRHERTVATMSPAIL